MITLYFYKQNNYERNRKKINSCNGTNHQQWLTFNPIMSIYMLRNQEKQTKRNETKDKQTVVL